VTICARLLRPRYLLWLAVPLLLLWAVHAVSLQDTWTVLARLDLTHILLLIAANGLVLLTLSGRWWLILRAQGYPISYMALAGYRLAAFGVSYFTPGPQFGGEPLQVHFVQRRHRVPRSTAIAAVTLDKSLELVANFTFLAGGITLILQGQVFPGVVGRQSILLPLVLLALPVGFLLAIWAGGHPISSLLGVGGRLFSWQRWTGRTGWFAGYQEAYQAIRAGEEQATRFCRESSLTLVQALLVSMVSWLAIAGEYWLVLHVLGLSPTPVQSISALTAARMAFLLPFPGGLGTLEASQVLALGALGMNPAAGISLSLLIRVRDVMLGGLGLWWGGISSLGPK
jgi:uncharacterized protein (TIRG00374 family)